MQIYELDDIEKQVLLGTIEEDNEPMRVPCCLCGQPTVRDPIYQDLCYRCIRAENE